MLLPKAAIAAALVAKFEIIGNKTLELQMEECVTLVKRDIVYTESLYV